MSWSKAYASLGAFNDNISIYPDYAGNEAVAKEVADQVDAARACVQHLIVSGAIGMSKDFHITLSGHANKDHEPASGWSNDCISISVSQKSPTVTIPVTADPPEG